MSESSFQQFAALARNLHQFKDAGLRIISLGGSASPDGRIRIYVQIPASTALKHGTARLIPISSTALAEAATTSKKAAANAAPAAGPTSSSTTKAASSVVAATTTAKAAADTAKALKDPIGQIVKEVQDKLPALEAAAKAEDLGAKAAKNLVERAKVRLSERSGSNLCSSPNRPAAFSNRSELICSKLLQLLLRLLLR